METIYSDVQNYDFFAEGKQDFYNMLTAKSILVQGKHRNPAPMISVLLTTCKRPDLLRQSLESALNQIDFDDYQIIVVDNEGEDINIETETTKLIAGYHDDKIVYYRHEKSVEYKMDSAVKLARSKWICFLHDDDLLASNHLYVMSQIVQKYKKIKFLSGAYQFFYDEISDEEFCTMTQAHKIHYQIRKYPKSYSCLGYYVFWQGALIDRCAYISTGGMPSINTAGLGDYCMIQKFHDRYGIYQLDTDSPLYFWRQWRGQSSSGGVETVNQRNRIRYYYNDYVIKVYHKFFRRFWNRINVYSIVDRYENLKGGYYEDYVLSADLGELVHSWGLPINILDKDSRYTMDMIWKGVYGQFVEKVCKPLKYQGEI